MVELYKIQRLIANAVFEETAALAGISSKEITLLPEAVLALMAGKAIILHRDEVSSGSEIRWVRDFEGIEGQPPCLCFEIISMQGNKEYLVLCFTKKQFAENLHSDIEQLARFNAKDTQLVLCTILNDTLVNQLGWIRKQKEIPLLETTGELTIPKDDSSVALQMWKLNMPSKKSTLQNPPDVNQAMREAVENMYFEKLMRIVKQVIYLKYHVDEEKIDPALPLYKIIRLAFAKEQGVTPEEVYDPETMIGITDSQLAVSNLLTDIEKVFAVSFEPEHIHTLNDLVEKLAFAGSR